MSASNPNASPATEFTPQRPGRTKDTVRAFREPLALDVSGVEEATTLSRRTIAHLAAIDAVPSHKVGGRRLYRPVEIDAWLALGGPTEPGAAARVRAYMASQEGGGQ